MSFTELPALLLSEGAGTTATVGYVVSAVITVGALTGIVIIAVRRYFRAPKD
ncbi:hypothetical protein [Cryobacterium psychrophilum]|uniref:hypothetical protein n=1 Tax=Cryobacterium psychrophilum TaxID=41988 RepID=UPI0010E0C475|nr:hypothetical protein [Cryobacterium psychrophilum]TDW29619.1 hypothetical protein EDD25_1329 [Cryobacterium psychrophilum]